MDVARAAIVRVLLMFTVIKTAFANVAAIVIHLAEDGRFGLKLLGVSHGGQREPTRHEQGDTTPQSSSYGRQSHHLRTLCLNLKTVN